MKNLIVFVQKSVLIFVVVFLSACAKEEEPSEFTSLPYEALKVLPNAEDKNSTPPIFIPDVRLKSLVHVRHLTLYDASMKNVITIKVATADQTLLNSLNAETIEFVAFEKQLPPSVPYEAVTQDLDSRSAFKPIEIEVIETRIQPNIKFYGIRFVKTHLLDRGLYELTYKHSGISSVHVSGSFVNGNLSRFTAQASNCPDCETKILEPKFLPSRLMISFIHDKKSSLSLKVNRRFAEDILILW